MKIAYLSDSTVPSRTANSIHVMKMCQALSRAGHQVLLFAPEKTKINTDIFSFYGVDKLFSVNYSPWIRLKGRGYWYGWKVSRKVNRESFDLAFGRNLPSSYFTAKLGIPVIFESHTPIEDESWLTRLLFRRLIRSSYFLYLVVITDSLRKHYEKHWPELQGRILVAPDGADPINSTSYPINSKKEPGRLQVGYTGHLYQGKGAELVVEIARACPEHDFHLVGGSYEDLQRWHSRHDLPNNLTLHGYHPHAEIARFLLAFDVALLPNQPEVNSNSGRHDIGKWTSPLKLFEYMAAGCAIICSDVPVLKEVAEHESNMMICRYDSVEEWVKTIRRLSVDTKLRKNLGAKAREQLETVYSWDARVKSLEAYFINSV